MADKQQWVVDLECDALLAEVTYISCFNIRNVANPSESYTFTKDGELGYQTVETGIEYIKAMLDRGDEFVAHNAQYDFGVFLKLYDINILSYHTQVLDTMLLSQLMFPKWYLEHMPLSKNIENKFLRSSHSLGAWSQRLQGQAKLETDDYTTITPELIEYLEADTQVTLEVLQYFQRQKSYPSIGVIQLEVYNTLVAAYYAAFGWYIDPKVMRGLELKYEMGVKRLDMKLSGCFTPYYREATPTDTRQVILNQLAKVYEHIQSFINMSFYDFVTKPVDYTVYAEFMTPKFSTKFLPDLVGLLVNNKVRDEADSFKRVAINSKTKSNIMESFTCQIEDKLQCVTLHEDDEGWYYNTLKAGKKISRNSSLWIEITNKTPNSILQTIVSPVAYYKNGKPKSKKLDTFKEEDGIFYRKVLIEHTGLHIPIELMEFKAGSRQSIAHFFKLKYDHRFTILSDSNNPVLNEDVMKTLPFEEAPLLAERFKLNKDWSMLKGIQKNMVGDRAFSSIQVLGACSTGRSSAGGGITKGFNVQQMSSDTTFRSMFTVPKGKKFITSDLSSAEMMLQAIALYPFDDGKFADIQENGDKDKGTDLHSINAKTVGITRKGAKPLWYSSMYGSSGLLSAWNINPTDEEISNITDKEFEATRKKLEKRCETIAGKEYYPLKKGVKVPLTDRVVRLSFWGNNLQKNMFAGVLGHTELVKSLVAEIRKNKGIISLDGRFIRVDSPHKALNYVLQSGNAILTKLWIYFSYELINNKYPIGERWMPIAVVHDEISVEADDDPILCSFITDMLDVGLDMACKHLKLPLDVKCESDVGMDWSMH